MANEDRAPNLPRRVPGATRGGSASSGSAVLSAEMRQHIQAAVKAERDDAAANDQENKAGTEHVPTSGGAGSDAASPVAHGADGATPARPAITGPAPDDDVTIWVARAPVPLPAATPAAQRRNGLRLSTRLAILTLGLAIALAALALVLRISHPSTPSAANRGATPARAAAVRNQAAAWVAQQVSPDAIVSCDPAMCAMLTAHGFPRRDLLVLGPASPVPVSSMVVVETPAVESLFGSKFATSWAPKVLASFGSGPAGITVRVIAPHGAAAYRNALNADLAARQNSGRALLNDNQIVVSATAREQLAAGAVDSRLLVAIAALAGHQPISIVRFGNVGQGADATVPLRFADLAQNDPTAQMSTSAYVQSARTYLNSVNTQFRPARTATITLPGGQSVLRVEFTAPSPFGVFGAPATP
jgi:hypothetical protein